MKLRAVCVALPIHPSECPREYLSILRSVRRAGESSPLPVWSYRIALKPLRLPDIDNPESLPGEAYRLVQASEFSYIALPLTGTVKELKAGENILFELAFNLARYRDVFISINPENLSVSEIPVLARIYLDLLRELSRQDLFETQCQISLVVNGPIETPYFPSAACLRSQPYLTVCMLYPGRIQEYVEKGLGVEESILKACREAEEAARRICKNASIVFAGVDTSISPWMSDSVVGLMRKLYGDPPLTLYNVLSLNKSLLNVSGKVRSLGFNEVMLPLAEDDLLKEMAGKALLRVRDLIYLSLACVAGVDMVPLPKADETALRRTMEDILAAALIKKRCMGARLIYSAQDPETILELGRFMDVPVPPL